MKLQGISGSNGIAIGTAFVYRKQEVVVKQEAIDQAELEQEIVKLTEAIDAATEQLTAIKNKVLVDTGEKQAEIFEAHIALVQDPALAEDIVQVMRDERVCAIAGVKQVVSNYCDIFAAMDDEYMRERAADIRDIGERLVRNLAGVGTDALSQVASQVIIIAEDLTPSDTVSLDKRYVLGFATKLGGRTSHAAIIARTLEIPAVMGLGEAAEEIKSGDLLIMDGNTGKVFVNPDAAVLAQYEAKQSRYRKWAEENKKLSGAPAVTTDGRTVEVVANIGSPQDIDAALEQGAEGVGLYRTEFLYLDKAELPGEEEQFTAYKTVAEKLGGKPLIIRTLDIGGDKEVACMQLPKEMNPFLGYRAMRICLDRVDIFKTQLRAILRASSFGNVLIMYPMISGLEELRQANKILAEVKDELRSAGIAFDQAIKVGIMVEIPSAAVTADLLIKEADFFSIGTNDLCQYTLAVDRINERISKLYQPFHPAVLRLIKNVIEVSNKHGKFTGMCGELAGDPVAAVLLLGLGLNEFSMSASSIPLVKRIIRTVSYEEAKQIADTALGFATAEEISAYCREVLKKLDVAEDWGE